MAPEIESPRYYAFSGNIFIVAGSGIQI